MKRKTKQIISIVIALVMMLSVISVAPFSVSAATSGDWEYTIEDDFTVTIDKYNGTDSVVNIPSTLGGYKVNTIGYSAFKGNDYITTVNFSNSITYIKDEAFSNCEFLKIVNLSSNLKTIEYEAFKSCESIESIIIPSKVSKIDEGAFANCSSLSKVKFNTKKIETLSWRLFADCTNLKNITIPEGVKKIDGRCFESSGIVSISISKTVNYIYNSGWNNWADPFENCKKLSKINVDSQNNTYSSINGVLVNKKKTLILYLPYQKTSFSVPNGVKYLSDDVFYGKINLKSIVIPPSVTSINGVGYCEGDPSWIDKKIAGFTVYGAKGSEAERYAINNDFTFIEMKPTSVKLSKSKVMLGVKESYALKATVSPNWLTSEKVKWSSSNSGIATVNSSGKITAKKSGTAVITATTSNGKTANCTVIVQKAPTKIKLSKKTAKLKKGQKLTLKVKFKSGQTSNKITWGTSNKKYAKVNSKGVVTAKKKGTCKITAKTYNGKKATCKIKVK